MFASLSAEVRAPELMRELGVSNAFVSAFSGIEQTKLSFAFRQLKPLSNAESEKLMRILHRLIVLRESLRPLAIDLKSPQYARAVFDAFEGQDADAIRAKVTALVGE